MYQVMSYIEKLVTPTGVLKASLAGCSAPTLEHLTLKINKRFQSWWEGGVAGNECMGCCGGDSTV